MTTFYGNLNLSGPPYVPSHYIEEHIWRWSLVQSNCDLRSCRGRKQQGSPPLTMGRVGQFDCFITTFMVILTFLGYPRVFPVYHSQNGLLQGGITKLCNF